MKQGFFSIPYLLFFFIMLLNAPSLGMEKALALDTSEASEKKIDFAQSFLANCLAAHWLDPTSAKIGPHNIKLPENLTWQDLTRTPIFSGKTRLIDFLVHWKLYNGVKFLLQQEKSNEITTQKNNEGKTLLELAHNDRYMQKILKTQGKPCCWPIEKIISLVDNIIHSEQNNLQIYFPHIPYQDIAEMRALLATMLTTPCAYTAFSNFLKNKNLTPDQKHDIFQRPLNIYGETFAHVIVKENLIDVVDDLARSPSTATLFYCYDSKKNRPCDLSNSEAMQRILSQLEIPDNHWASPYDPENNFSLNEAFSEEFSF